MNTATEPLHMATEAQVRTATALFAEINGYIDAPVDVAEDTRSQKARDIELLIPAFGSISSGLPVQMAKFATLVIGEEVQAPHSERSGAHTIAVPLACVVPLRNTNSHDYPIGEPVILRYGFSTLYVISGGTGNTLTDYKDDLRPATDAEITKALTYFHGL